MGPTREAAEIYRVVMAAGARDSAVVTLATSSADHLSGFPTFTFQAIPLQGCLWSSPRLDAPRAARNSGLQDNDLANRFRND